MNRRDATLALLIAAALSGCRGGADSRTRGATVAPPRSLYPRGTTIPAAGLGVDLVRSPDRDGSAIRASLAE